MASQVNNIGTTAVIIFIVLVLFGGLYYVMQEVTVKNTKLDPKSEQVITSLGIQYEDNLKNTSFVTGGTGDFNDSNFDGVDAFVRQYLEDKSEIEQKQTLLNKVLLFPSILISIFGVDDITILSIFSGLVWGLLSFLIGLQLYKAIKGEVD